MALLQTPIVQELKNLFIKEEIIFWLDTDSVFMELVDTWEKNGDLKFPILRFRGSFLESMLEINRYLGKQYNDKFLVYLEGVSESQVEMSPFYETFLNAKRVQFSLSALVENTLGGLVSQDKLEEVVREGGGVFFGTEALVERTKNGLNSRLSALLEKYSTKQLGFELLLEDSSILKAYEGRESEILGELKTYFKTHLGFESEGEMDLKLYLDGLAEFMFKAEFYMDLGVELVSEIKISVTTIQLKNIQFILEQLRRTHRDRYVTLEERISSKMDAQKREIFAEYIQKGVNILGKVDTFEFEEKYLSFLCISQMEKNNYSEAVQTAGVRLKNLDTEKRSIWLSVNGNREKLWLWIEKACELSLKLQEIEQSLKLYSRLDLDGFLKAYAEEKGLWKMDRCFREMITFYHDFKMNSSGDERINVLEENKKLSKKYYKVLNEVNEIYGEACKTYGILPNDPKNMQRNFYSEYILPHYTKERFVLFVVDALRFELGEKLYRELEKETYEKTLHLEAQYSELPTQTSIGMNAMMPVADSDNKMNLVYSRTNTSMDIRGFKVNQFTVSTIQERKRSLEEKMGDLCNWLALEEFHSRSDWETLSKKRILVIHSREIDELGETNSSPSTDLNYFDYSISKIKGAIHRLIDLGFQNFLITSDHGFILTGDERPPEGSTAPVGQEIISKRRYYFSSHEFEKEGLVRASFQDLHYTTSEKGYFYFPKNIAPLSYLSFYHDGNSLQERIVPVLRLKVGQQFRPENLENYELKTIRYESSIGETIHRFKIHLEASQVGLFGTKRIEMELFSKLEDVLVEIQSIDELQASENRFNLPVGKETEVFFKVSSYQHAEVLLSLRYRDDKNRVKEIQLEPAYKTILARAPMGGNSSQTVKDPEMARIVNHISQFGSITDKTILTMFQPNGARTGRRFALFIRENREHLPFPIKSDGQDETEGTIYRKEE